MTYEDGSFAQKRLLLPGFGEGASRRKLWIGAAIVVVVLVAAFFAFRPSGSAPADAAKGGQAQLPRVSVMVPLRQTVQSVITATGTLAARREMPVGVAGEGGMVTHVLVEPGQWVGAGQVLALVDRSVQTQQAAALNAQIGVARSDLTLAQAELDRAQQLVSRGFISQADVQRRIATRDAAAARLKVAQAQYSETGARNRRLDIRAPAAGLVLTRGVEPGQIVSSASGVLFRMARGGEMELRALLAEADLAKMAVGVPAKVTPVGTAQSFDGQVWQVSPVIDPQNRQGVARIALSYNPALRPGGFAQATITSGAAEAPLLPETAVQSDDTGNFVYVVGTDNKVVRRAVTVGEVSDAGVAVKSGLAGNERVVVSAGAFLNQGQKVVPVLQKAR